MTNNTDWTGFLAVEKAVDELVEGLTSSIECPACHAEVCEVCWKEDHSDTCPERPPDPSRGASEGT